ncbi:MAG: YlbF family regulator [Oscillospiraceae bacterium]|nr:YlbF family regulator [Oscillospiraceae bacterium]MBQ4310998.1 YlbF family regulator [Oscillospiraceae bacterium]MCR5167989.1 YlbF family regulator [Oscillospiraceae bacterium]
MTIIEKARELGMMIQADERYTAFNKAKAANDADEALQKMISEFNELRLGLNAEMSKSDKSSEKIVEFDRDIKELYGRIMANENMAEYTKAKNAMDAMLSQINAVITYSANGEDPMTCPVFNLSSCGGSCEGCGGCG